MKTITINKDEKFYIGGEQYEFENYPCRHNFEYVFLVPYGASAKESPKIKMWDNWDDAHLSYYQIDENRLTELIKKQNLYLEQNNI
jgi:hypothetical protein